jgi:KDO2-lipid IV(A) lauroyltransferase
MAKDQARRRHQAAVGMTRAGSRPPERSALAGPGPSPTFETAVGRPREGSRRTVWIQSWRGLRQGAYRLLELLAVGGALGLFACLPIDVASAVGGFTARLIGPRIGASRRMLRSLERAMPEHDAATNRRILVETWDNLGRTVAEYPHLAHICAPGSARVEIVNGGEIAALAAGGGPVILFGGHLGNWEVCASMSHRLMGASLLSVYRAANNPLVDRLLRRRLGTRKTVAKGAAGGRTVIRHLSEGGHLAMLVDQKMNDGIAVPFFGRTAMTAPAIARLGLRFGCPIVPIRVERTQGARFRFTVQPAIAAIDSGDAAADTLATMTRVNAIIESWVRARPGQWLWLHRRWPD